MSVSLYYIQLQPSIGGNLSFTVSLLMRELGATHASTTEYLPLLVEANEQHIFGFCFAVLVMHSIVKTNGNIPNQNVTTGFSNGLWEL